MSTRTKHSKHDEDDSNSRTLTYEGSKFSPRSQGKLTLEDDEYPLIVISSIVGGESTGSVRIKVEHGLAQTLTPESIGALVQALRDSLEAALVVTRGESNAKGEPE